MLLSALSRLAAYIALFGGVERSVAAPLQAAMLVLQPGGTGLPKEHRPGIGRLCWSLCSWPFPRQSSGCWGIWEGV